MGVCRGVNCTMCKNRAVKKALVWMRVRLEKEKTSHTWVENHHREARWAANAAFYDDAASKVSSNIPTTFGSFQK